MDAVPCLLLMCSCKLPLVLQILDQQPFDSETVRPASLAMNALHRIDFFGIYELLLDGSLFHNRAFPLMSDLPGSNFFMTWLTIKKVARNSLQLIAKVLFLSMLTSRLVLDVLLVHSSFAVFGSDVVLFLAGLKCSILDIFPVRCSPAILCSWCLFCSLLTCNLELLMFARLESQAYDVCYVHDSPAVLFHCWCSSNQNKMAVTSFVRRKTRTWSHPRICEKYVRNTSRSAQQEVILLWQRVDQPEVTVPEYRWTVCTHSIMLNMGNDTVEHWWSHQRINRTSTCKKEGHAACRSARVVQWHSIRLCSTQSTCEMFSFRGWCDPWSAHVA